MNRAKPGKLGIVGGILHILLDVLSIIIGFSQVANLDIGLYVTFGGRIDASFGIYGMLTGIIGIIFVYNYYKGFASRDIFVIFCIIGGLINYNIMIIFVGNILAAICVLFDTDEDDLY